MSGLSRTEFEELWARLYADAESSKFSEIAVFELTDFYRLLDEDDRSVADEVVTRWVTDGDASQRFVALSIIEDFEIRSALPALRSDLSRVNHATGPSVPWDRERLERIIALLEHGTKVSEPEELRDFAERLIRLVRDRAIVSCDQYIAGETRGPIYDRWRSVVRGVRRRRALKELTPDVVDRVLFELLDAIDNDQLPLGLRRPDGSYVALKELGRGEMASWLMMGSEGWLDRFSSQRYFDPLEGVDLES
jgi:hypothetical protein